MARGTCKESVVRKRWFWDIVLGVLLASSIIYLMFFTVAFKVNKVEITVSEIYSADIYSIVAESLGKPIFLVDKSDVEKKVLEDFPEIKVFNLKRKLPGSIFLEIRKREPVGVFCSLNSTSTFLADVSRLSYIDCPKIDKTGKLFYEETEDKLPVIWSDEVEISPKEIDKITQIKNELENNIKLEIARFVLFNKSRLNVQIVDSWAIYFDLDSDIALALTKLRLLLEKGIDKEQQKNLEYIDLRFTKAYYQ